MTKQRPKPAHVRGTLPEPARDELSLTAEERDSLTQEELAMLADIPRQYARATTHSIMSSSRVIEAAERGTSTGKTADWRGAMEELQAASDRLRKNDLSQVEDALGHQAIALQALFVRLTEMAFNSLASPHQFDVLMRYSLRAQAQGRATLEALAEIKNPPVLFARQANIANGPQQINNGDASRVRGGKVGSEHNELSGDEDELHPNGRAPAIESGADPGVAPLGRVDGSPDRSRKSALVAQRVERRRPATASGSATRPAAGGRANPSGATLTK